MANMVKLSFPPSKRSRSNIRLSGVSNGDSWNGYGEDSAGNKLTWTATLVYHVAGQSRQCKEERYGENGKGHLSFSALWLGRKTQTGKPADQKRHGMDQ